MPKPSQKPTPAAAPEPEPEPAPSSDPFLAVQDALVAKLNADAGLPPSIRVSARREKGIRDDIEQALKSIGLHVFVMPLLPAKALRTECAAIFFPSVEVRVRVSENVVTSRKTGVNCYEVATKIMLTLQGFNPVAEDGSPLLAGPLQLAPTPAAFVQDPELRVMDVLLEAAIQIA